MLHDLQKYEPADSDRGKPCWNLGTIEIEQASARALLGEPHFIETNTYATAGGTEDHWTFQSEMLPIIFIRLRVPYSQMDVHVAAIKIPNGIWDVFTELFPNHTQHRHERPFDEMRHPDDLGFYYNDIL